MVHPFRSAGQRRYSFFALAFFSSKAEKAFTVCCQLSHSNTSNTHISTQSRVIK